MNTYANLVRPAIEEAIVAIDALLANPDTNYPYYGDFVRLVRARTQLQAVLDFVPIRISKTPQACYSERTREDQGKTRSVWSTGLQRAVTAYKRARDEAARLILAGQARHGQLADYEDDVLAPLRHAMYRAAGLDPQRGG